MEARAKRRKYDRYAEGERLAVMNHIKANPWSADVLREGMDPDYDVLAARRAVRSSSDQ